jgi:drug/metabolite transporter (DMT)-like permease
MVQDTETGLVFDGGGFVRQPFALRVAQANALFGALYLLLATRLVLTYVGVDAASFAVWVRHVTAPFVLPLVQLVSDGTDPAGHPIAWSIVIALVVYGIVHGLLVRTLRAIGRPHFEMD